MKRFWVSFIARWCITKRGVAVDTALKPNANSFVPCLLRGQLSWLEHLPYKQGVTGSSPVLRTIKTHTAIYFIMLTVNLLTIKTSLVISGSSSDGRTPDLGSGGRRFKSCLSDHIDTYSKFKDTIFMLLVQIQLCSFLRIDQWVDRKTKKCLVYKKWSQTWGKKFQSINYIFQ